MILNVDNHVEAAAMAVILVGMGREIVGVGEVDGEWQVELVDNIPSYLEQGIRQAIKKDQQSDPQKWADAMAGVAVKEE